MKLTSLSESDEKTRDLERAAASGDDSAVMALAMNYIRAGNPRVSELIDDLRRINDPNATEIIKTWAEINSIPTSEEFNRSLRERGGTNFTTAETLAVEAGLKMLEYDQNGRGGYYYCVNIYRSPADGNYIWLAYGNEEGNGSFNYGSITHDDLEAARADYGGEEQWQDWGMLDYFRDYLY